MIRRGGGGLGNRGVGIVAADLAVGGVPVDHGIHVARGITPQNRFGRPRALNGSLLCQSGWARCPRESPAQHAADHSHAEAGMVDVGVAGHQNHVAAVPAKLLHLLAARGQEWCRAKALGPIGAVAAQRLGVARKKGTSTGAFKAGFKGGVGGRASVVGRALAELAWGFSLIQPKRIMQGKR